MSNLILGLFLTVISALFLVLSNTFKKTFKKDCVIFYTFLCCVFADLVFIFASGFKFDFNAKILPYAILFAVSYSSCVFFSLKAYKIGNFSIVGLVTSYSLILPTLYGLTVLKEKVNAFFYIGLALLFISIYVINMPKKSQEEKPKKRNFLWLVFLIVAFIGNGFCSIFQTAEQKAFDGAYKSELMIIALTLSAIIFLVVSLITEKNKIKEGGVSALKFASLSGVFNGLLNLGVMFSVGLINASLVFPVLSGISLIFTFITGVLAFKEKYSLTEYVGFIVSIISVVLLNL